MKANFKISKSAPDVSNEDSSIDKPSKELTKEEFEDYMSKSGASGSFMIYRSNKKNEELGMDEL